MPPPLSSIVSLLSSLLLVTSVCVVWAKAGAAGRGQREHAGEGGPREGYTTRPAGGPGGTRSGVGA